MAKSVNKMESKTVDSKPEAEFLDVIGTKVWTVFILAIHSHIYRGFYSLPTIEQKLFETGL